MRYNRKNKIKKNKELTAEEKLVKFRISEEMNKRKGMAVKPPIRP